MGVKFKFTVEDYDAISFILGKMIKKTKLLLTAYQALQSTIFKQVLIGNLKQH